MGLRPYNSVGGFSVGVSADQFIDSSRNISASGATFSGNISAPNIVNSFNGSTGAVTYAPPLATTSVTGVASFGDEFVVSALGAVSLTANYVKSINGVTGTPSLTANSASNITLTVQGSNIFVALGILSGTAEPSGGTDGNIYLQYTV